MNKPLAEELNLIETLSKHFAVALGFLYLVGFLVVTSYLSRYGVSSFAALQLQYLIAGFWVLGPPVIYNVIIETRRRFEEWGVPEVEGKFDWRRFAVSSLYTTIPNLAFISLLFLIPNFFENLTWSIGIRWFLFYLAMVYFADLFWMSWRVTDENASWWKNRSHAAPLYLTTVFVMVMAYAVWFAVRIYPLIPFSLGGGKPRTIVFVEGDKKLPDEIKKSDQSVKRSMPYKLVLESDRYYVVVSPNSNEKSLEVSRDSVAGIVVLD